MTRMRPGTSASTSARKSPPTRGVRTPTANPWERGRRARMPGGTVPRMPAKLAPQKPLDRGSPQREPALELLLDRQFLADLRLEHELALVVAPLGAGGGRERIERPALVVVNPVDRALGSLVVEPEHRAQHALAVATGLERARDRVDPDDQIVEVAAAEHQPAKAIRVV